MYHNNKNNKINNERENRRKHTQLFHVLLLPTLLFMNKEHIDSLVAIPNVACDY